MIRQQLLILFSLMTSLAYAQPYVGTIHGDFQVDQKKGCAPFTVTATALVASPTYQFDFLGTGSGSGLVITNSNTASFSYTTPGTYKLRFCTQNNCGAAEVDEIEIEVVADIVPEFDLYTCSGNGVQVKVNDTNYNQYVISYSDATTVTVPSGSLAKDTHLFTTAGAKTIQVRGRNLNAADNCSSQTKNFSAVAALPLPSLTGLTTLTPTQIDVRYALPVNVLGRIDIATNNNTTFQQLKSVFDDARDTLQNFSTESNFYCFRIGAVDACTNSVTYDPVSVCSIVFTATAKDGFNQLDWINNPAAIVDYNLSRDNAAYVGGISSTATTRNDVDAICNTEHCYQLTANYSNGATSTSLQKCALSFTTQKPPVITDLTATFNAAGSVEVTWADAIEAVDYVVFKNTSGGPFSLAATQEESPYLDTQFDLASPSCYEVLYQDACNNVSDISIIACPIVLTASVSTDNIVTLTWTPYEGWQSGAASYRLEKYSSSGTLLRVYSLGSATTFVDEETDLSNQLTTYKVFANAVTPGLGPVNSNSLDVIRRPNLFYATAFTPDKTGPPENETFKVYGQYVANFEMKIYNRWGELMFTVNDFDKGWDGTFRGVDQPDGTYAFVSTITDFAGRTSTRSGSIVLLRKK